MRTVIVVFVVMALIFSTEAHWGKTAHDLNGDALKAVQDGIKAKM